MSERRRDGKVKGEKWKVKGGLTRWGIDRILFILIHPWPESLVIISSGLHTMNNIDRRYHASFLKIFFILK